MFGGLRKGEFVCKTGKYRTEIISIDPLLIYINNFVDETEIKGLIAKDLFFVPLLPFDPLII